MRLVLILATLWVSSALASPTWTVLPMQTRGVDTHTAQTFRDLFIAELGADGYARFVNATMSCTDVPCATKAGRAVSAQVAIYGGLSTLGRNIVVTLTAVDTLKGTVKSQQRMSVNQVEDLEHAAARLAEAILNGTTVETTAHLGNITRKDVRPDRRREGYRGLSLRVGGGGLLGDADDSGGAVRFDLGYWYEARQFALEPQFSVRFSADDTETSAYALHLDMAAYYIPGLGDFTPFIGGGGGVRRVGTKQRFNEEAGQVVKLTTETIQEESAWGPGAFGRLGLLFFRSYSVRMSVSIDYDVTFTDLFGDGPAQVVSGGIGVLF